MLFKMTEPEAKPISPPRSELTLPCRDARGSPLRLGLGDEIWQGHILVTGGTGSGKTTVIRQLLARCRDIWPEASFIVLDVKGDYIPPTAGPAIRCFPSTAAARTPSGGTSSRRPGPRHTRRTSWTRWYRSCSPVV